MKNYLRDLRVLLVELRSFALNNNNRQRKASPGQPALRLYKHLDTFLEKFASSAGTGLGKGIGVGVGLGLGIGATGLLVGTASALFHYAGLSPQMISHLFHAPGAVTHEPSAPMRGSDPEREAVPIAGGRWKAPL